MADIFNMLDTWNASGTTFTGIKLNVTDTASAAGSLLMDLQVGGGSLFSVSKAGGARGVSGFEVYTTSGLERATIGQFLTYFKGSTDYRIVVNDSGGAAGIGLSSGSSTADVLLRRDAANTLAQRNGVNAQAFNLYQSYTDASNYERGFMRFVSNALEIGTQAAGTGAARSMAFQTGGVTRFSVTSNLNEIVFNGDGRISRQSSFGGVVFNADNSITIGAGGAAAILGGYMQVTEMTAPAAPATNGVRIYAEDDGAGKTRLMARFATGAAVQIAIEP